VLAVLQQLGSEPVASNLLELGDPTTTGRLLSLSDLPFWSELMACISDYATAGGFKGQDLAVADYGLPQTQLTPLARAVRAILVGRGQQYTIQCAPKADWIDGSTLILYLVNYNTGLIDTVTLTARPAESSPPPAPVIAGQDVASDLPLHDCTTAQDCAERINGVLLSLPGNYLAYPGPVIVGADTLETTSSVPTEIANGADYDPTGTAIGHGVVAATKDGLGSLPLVNLLSLISALETLASTAQAGYVLTGSLGAVASLTNTAGNVAALDLTFVCPAESPFVLSMTWVKDDATARALLLRASGAAATGWGFLEYNLGFESNISAYAGSDPPPVVSAEGAGSLTIVFSPSVGGKRTYRGFYADTSPSVANSTNNIGAVRGVISAGDIASIGVSVAGNHIANGSSIRASVGAFCRDGLS
jgi:hypothetical protein